MRALVVFSFLLTLACSEGADPRMFPQPDAAVLDLGDVGSTPLDSGERDSGARDAGDVGEREAGIDSGPADLGGMDMGGDAGPVDSQVDSGADSGVADMGPTDNGVMDAQPPDSGMDAGAGDAGMPFCDFPQGLVTPLGAYNATLACMRDPLATDVDKLNLIQRFVEFAERSHGGFPIVDRNGLIFFYVARPEYDREDDKNVAEDFDIARRTAPISVAGDFNNFMPGQDILQDEGLGVFHGRFTFAGAPGDRWRYKFVARDAANADVWFSDPLSLRFDYDQNGRISIVAGGTTQGHLELLRVPSTNLGGVRDVFVYLPPGYEGQTNRLPLLVAHDGNNLFDANQPRAAPVSWELDAVIERELALGSIRPFIVLAVTNSAARIDEYTHVQDNIGGGLVGGSADDHADFVVQELLPLANLRFRTSTSASERGVIGSSLGGLASYHAGLLHPTVFGFVGGLSSTFGWGQISANNPTMLDRYNQTPGVMGRNQRFYLDSGGGPGNGCPGGSVDNYCQTIDMLNGLQALGFTDFPDNPDVFPLTPATIDIMHWWQTNAAHNEAAWNARVHRALRLFARP